MLKSLLIGFILILPIVKVNGQTPKELLLAIQKSKPDTNRISLLLKLGGYYLSKPGDLKNTLDSGYKFITQATELSDKLHETEWQYKALTLAGSYYAKTGDFVRCKQCFMRAIAYYHQIGSIAKEAAAWYRLGDLYNDYFVNDVEERETISYYQHAYSLYIQNHQSVIASDILNKIASLRIDYKQFDLAEKELQQALSLYKASGYKKLQGTYKWLYVLENGKGNFYRCLAYASEGIKSMKASGDMELASFLYQAMAKSYYSVKKYNEALEWIRKAVAADKGPNVFTYTTAQIQTLLDLHRTEEARAALNDLSKIKFPRTFADTLNQYRVTALYYDKINKNDLAVRYYNKILESNRKKYSTENYYNKWSLICNNEIAGVYLKTNQAAKAEKYIKTAGLIVENAKTVIDPRFLVVFYDHLYKYNVATGNFQDAVKYLELHNRIQDSLFTVDKDNKIAELDIQYQTAQKEQSIKDLHNQSTIQKSRLEEANFQKNITIAGIVVLFVAAAIAYYAYRQKQRSNLELQAKQQQLETKQQQINTQNTALQNLVTEKDWLLKEVHHRVKNNLHTVICLLESQSAYLENDALKAIEISQHRIYAMSMIHQKLYQSEDVKMIDIEVYINEFVQYLADSFGPPDNVSIKLDITQVKLDVSQAIPIGLILNEAVTNSFKYAFPNGKRGEIFIGLKQAADVIELVIADNGIGMPQQPDDVQPNSLGVELMKGLTDDIEGTIRFDTNKGTKITVTFAIAPLDRGTEAAMLNLHSNAQV